MNRLVSAAAQPLTRVQSPAGRSLAARAAAQHVGRRSAILDRVTEAARNVPSASAFQSAL
ncbi:hypothetical protein [Streptomyces sp. NPDC007172]|uniref:hypothetical protein n=1 Tax=Streptomyces sp. NPDC007172 TaxID=3364776 RepID=UPI0036CDF886